MKNHYPTIFIFTALECEAKAIITQLKLKKENAIHPFSIHKNDKFILTITGVGKVAMAAGVSYTLALFSKTPLPVLINIGIAGHKTKPIGDLVLASKVVDADSKKVFYPQLIGAHWPETSKVNTTAIPNSVYDVDCLNDMEASAFYETAVKFSSCELIHSLKVVSDNQNNGVETIQAKTVAELLARHGDAINTIFNHLEQIRASVTPEEQYEYNEIINTWRFTVAGQVKLKQLLRRWGALSSRKWINEGNMTLTKGKDVLRKLEADINSLEVYL